MGNPCQCSTPGPPRTKVEEARCEKKKSQFTLRKAKSFAPGRVNQLLCGDVRSRQLIGLSLETRKVLYYLYEPNLILCIPVIWLPVQHHPYFFLLIACG